MKFQFYVFYWGLLTKNCKSFFNIFIWKLRLKDTLIRSIFNSCFPEYYSYKTRFLLLVARGTLQEIQILRRCWRLPTSTCEYFWHKSSAKYSIIVRYVLFAEDSQRPSPVIISAGDVQTVSTFHIIFVQPFSTNDTCTPLYFSNCSN